MGVFVNLSDFLSAGFIHIIEVFSINIVNRDFGVFLRFLTRFLTSCVSSACGEYERRLGPSLFRADLRTVLWGSSGVMSCDEYIMIFHKILFGHTQKVRKDEHGSAKVLGSSSEPCQTASDFYHLLCSYTFTTSSFLLSSGAILAANAVMRRARGASLTHSCTSRSKFAMHEENALLL